MKSSVPPTPVMPKTATAVTRPLPGSCGRRPDKARSQENTSGMRVSTTAASTVSSVKKPTFTSAKRSMRS